MNINNFVQTVTSAVLPATGDDAMVLRLMNPPEPFNLPYNGCGYVLLMERKSNDSGGCVPTQVEIIKYDGFGEDGQSLKVVERGVGGTDVQEWSVGTVVQQPFLQQNFDDLNQRIQSLECLAIADTAREINQLSKIWSNV